MWKGRTIYIRIGNVWIRNEDDIHMSHDTTQIFKRPTRAERKKSGMAQTKVSKRGVRFADQSKKNKCKCSKCISSIVHERSLINEEMHLLE